MNELLLIASIFVIFGGTVIFYKLFDEMGLYSFLVIATIAANIEVLILVNAFGMEQTLGNVLFASTFLVTDILSEIEGKESAKKAVNIGIASSIIFILVSQSWLLYVPSSNDFISPALRAVFSNTPRMMIAGLVVYIIVQKFDVWSYHKWWKFTEKKTGDSRKFLWFRNNISTLVSQLLNTVLFNLGAFLGTYDTKTLISIIVSGYLVFIILSICDTPFLYLARSIRDKKEAKLS